MPALVVPTVDVQQSFLAALVEFHREGRYADLDLRALRQPSAFAAYLDELAAEAKPDTQQFGDRSVAARVTQRSIWRRRFAAPGSCTQASASTSRRLTPSLHTGSTSRSTARLT